MGVYCYLAGLQNSVEIIHDHQSAIITVSLIGNMIETIAALYKIRTTQKEVIDIHQIND
jgi:hypothetical protein